jgi:hypothetical protein
MPETTRESFTAQEELVLCLVLCFENMGLCARLAELNQQHLKAAANALVLRDLLYRCYDCEERGRPTVEDMDYGLTYTGRKVAQALFDASGKTHGQVLEEASRSSAP